MGKKLIVGTMLAGVLALSGCMGIFGEEQSKNPVLTYDYSKMHLIQLEEPYEGQPTVTLDTTVGTIKAVLYPEQAPDTVSNFLNRAKDGYYNGKDIYGIFDKSIFMSGAENKQRDSGVTEDGQPIPNEYSVDLWTFKGAFCSFFSSSGYGDSRFFIVNQQELSDEDMTSLRELKNDSGQPLLPEELITAFKEKGSVAGLAGLYTVFGQTVEGFDVIEKICNTETKIEEAEKLLHEFIDSFFAGGSALSENWDEQKMKKLNGYFSADALEANEPAVPIIINSMTVGEYHAG